jgi:hypothetical protein
MLLADEVSQAEFVAVTAEMAEALDCDAMLACFSEAARLMNEPESHVGRWYEAM